ncbi:MAG: Ku protein [Gemmatimonadetes bacterium]|nr:Ku protein [Gemmatimonadota bacterium]
MAARPIASATVSFGLVSVPVQLYAAGETQGAISFNWLHKKDGQRLKQQYVCSADGEKVEKDDMVKGFEFSKGKYVQFTTEEIKALDEKATGAIEIKEFVPASKVDRIYVDRTYFLGPNKGAERAYHLLTQALQETGRAALGQYAARGKQYLVLLRPLDGGLAMEQLHYANEVRSMKEVPLGEGNVKEQELKLAVQLIEQTATDEFKPEMYRDTVRERVMESIEKKVQSGEEITAEPEAAPQTQIIDLMEALKASVAKGKAAEEAAEESAKKPTRRKKAS